MLGCRGLLVTKGIKLSSIKIFIQWIGLYALRTNRASWTSTCPVWNLANGHEVEETKKQVEKYRKENELQIKKNNVKLGREEALVMSQLEEQLKQEELRRAQVAMLEKQERNDKKKENEEFLDKLVKGDRSLDDIIAEHANKLQKKSLLFSAQNTQLTSLQKETFVPLPLAEGPKFKYVAPQVITDGPAAPQMEVLAARGYLRHIRTATEGEKAGGYTSELACGRAIQEAFSALYMGAE